MRVNITTLVVVSALVISGAAMAQDAAAPAPTSPPVHNKDDDVYCRTETTLGSNIEKRICRTQREWKQITEQSRQTLDGMTNRNSLGYGAGAR